MNSSDSLVKQQYTEWVYPEPIEDLAIWAAKYSQICDPAFHQALIWPERAPPSNPSILVAGCGTSQAAILAYTNPQARVIGIDVSPASLEHAIKLKAKHTLDNLELRVMDLHDVTELGQAFDLIYATGVLHHLSDPSKGLRALTQVMANDGVMCVMLYAKYMRAGVSMVQEALRHLQAEQNATGIIAARNILDSLPRWHAARPYLRGAAGDLNDDACLVDTFLHKQERAYTVPEILELTNMCGLKFQGWTDNLDYYPDGAIATEHPAYAAITVLPDEKQWAVTELLYNSSACHSFLLRKKGDEENVHPTFNDASFLHWIPARRYLLNVDDNQNATVLTRSNHTMKLQGLERALFLAIDGMTSCGALIEKLSLSKNDADKARRFFLRMMRCGHLTFSRYKSAPK